MPKAELAPQHQSLQTDAAWQDEQRMPWQRQGSWYQALMRCLNISDQAFFYLPDTADSWQLALYSDDSGTCAKSLSNYYSCALGPHAPLTAEQWQQCFYRLVQHLPQCRQLQLEPVSVTELSMLKASKIAGWRLIVEAISHNWQASTADYWSKRSSQLRNTIARKRKKLEQLGAVIQISGEIDASLQQHYWRVYQRSWKPQEPSPDFINQLLQQASTEGSLRFGVLTIGEEPVAVQCWLVAGGVAAIYKLAQDQQFDTLSPGTVLTAAMVDYVMTHDKVHTIDFLTGNDSYKAQWMDQCKPLYRVSAFRLSSPSALLRYLVLMAKDMLKRLRNQEPR